MTYRLFWTENTGEPREVGNLSADEADMLEGMVLATCGVAVVRKKEDRSLKIAA